MRASYAAAIGTGQAVPRGGRGMLFLSPHTRRIGSCALPQKLWLRPMFAPQVVAPLRRSACALR